MVSKYTFFSIAVLCFILQFRNGIATTYYDDEDCNPALISKQRHYYEPEHHALSERNMKYQQGFDGHRRLIFPKNGVTISFNHSVTGRYIHPHSKHYIINVSVGILNVPRYIRVFIGWIRFITELTDKAKTFLFRLLIRSFRLFLEWPLHRAQLIMNYSIDLVSVLKYLMHVMFPEWSTYEVELIFEGYVSGSVPITVVYKRIFIRIYPEWPIFEVNQIFDGTDSLVIVLERLVLQLYPNWPSANYIFQGSDSVTTSLKKFVKLMLPSFNINAIVSNSNSVFAIFEKVLMILFPGWPNENTFLISWTFLKLFYPYYIQIKPKLTYYKTSANDDQKILDKLLSDLQVDIAKEISSSSIDLRKLFIMSFGGQTPDLSTKLTGMFDALFGEFSVVPSGGSPPPQVITYDADNFFSKINIDGVPISSNWWNKVFPEVPMPVEPISVVPVTPKPTPSPDGSGLHGGVDLHVTWSSHSIPVLQNGGSGSNSFCRLPNGQYMVMPFNTWLQKLNPSDEVQRLLFVGEPGFDVSIMKNEYAVPEALVKLLFNWPDYQNKLTMYGKIPVTHAVKFFIPSLLYNWPKLTVMQITRDTNSIRIILQRIFERIFYSWRPFVASSATPIHLILKRLLLLILPDTPKRDVQQIFGGTSSLSEIFHQLFKVSFPHWPEPELGYIPFHIDRKIVKKIIDIIFNWPKYEPIFEIHSAGALPAAISKLTLMLVPNVPQHELDMVIHGKVGLSLLISRYINILNPSHVIPLDINVHDDHTLNVPYWAFEVLFFNWPHYEADVNDKDLQTTPAFRRCLNWLRSQIVVILHKASCSDPIVYAWVGELASALLEYSIETLPSVYADKRLY